MSRRVEFSQFGGPEVLRIVDVEPPQPGPGEVRVRVLAAGINPYDSKVFRGMMTSSPADIHFPSGNGNDFAGVVDDLGEGVTTLQRGDRVFGGKASEAQADFLTIPADRISRIPAGLDVEKAGSLDTVGRTAWASTTSLGLGPEDTVLVSAAAGGVGVVAAQLAKRTGATVIGSASTANHDFLSSLGIVPVEYGDGLVAAVRRISPDGITAALDNDGRGTVEAALELGAPAGRVNSIADYAAPGKYGITDIGARHAGLGEIAQLADLVASGEIVFPIDSMFPLERVSEAYTRLIASHLRGKIVLLTE